VDIRLTVVGLLCAIVSAVIALVQTGRTQEEGRGFAIAGLVISAAWVALICIWLKMGAPIPVHPSTK
jgi:hypothetical protein